MPFKKLEFEGNLRRVPHNYDAILKVAYGKLHEFLSFAR